jgi:ArsR family transcriptional regulator
MKRPLPLAEPQDCCAPSVEPQLPEGDVEQLGRLFAALADRHRIRIVDLLLTADPQALCVCEFMPALGLPQPNVSYHLKKLLDAGAIVRETRGTYSYYSLAPRARHRLRALLAADGPVLAEAV